MTTTLSGGRKSVGDIPKRDLPIHSFAHPANMVGAQYGNMYDEKEHRVMVHGLALELYGIDLMYVPFELRRHGIDMKERVMAATCQKDGLPEEHYRKSILEGYMLMKLEQSNLKLDEQSLKVIELFSDKLRLLNEHLFGTSLDETSCNKLT